MKKTLGIIGAVLAATGVLYAANEITLQVLLQATKGSSQLSRQPGALSLTWNGQRFNSQTLVATPSWQAITKGGVAAQGYCYLRNMAPTNTYPMGAVTSMVTAEISFDVGVTTNLMLKQSEIAVFRINSAFDVTNIMVKTRGATGDVEVTILED
jgi:hypothetical protein